MIYTGYPSGSDIWRYPSHLLENKGEYGRDFRYRTVRPCDLDNNNYIQPPHEDLWRHETNLQRENAGNLLFAELEEQLQACFDNMGKWTAPADREEIDHALDQVMKLLSEIQDRLLDLYPNTAERARKLDNFLHHRQEDMAATLKRSGLTGEDQQVICAHFNTNFSVLVNSMQDQSDEFHPFYIELQDRAKAQCGRHAANMFFGAPLLEDADYYENINCDHLFRKMNDRDPRADTEGPLSMYDTGLLAYMGNRQPGCQWGINADALDQLPGDFVLTAGGHHVCFKKDRHQWYLLDSLHGIPRQVMPSAYLQEVFGDPDCNHQYLNTNLNGRIAIICRKIPGEPTGFVETTN